MQTIIYILPELFLSFSIKIFFIAGSSSHAIAEVVPATRKDKNNARKILAIFIKKK